MDRSSSGGVAIRYIVDGHVFHNGHYGASRTFLSGGQTSRQTDIHTDTDTTDHFIPRK